MPEIVDSAHIEDKLIECLDCHMKFVFSAKDQLFYLKNKYADPKRCKKCRDIKKAKFAGRSL